MTNRYMEPKVNYVRYDDHGGILEVGYTAIGFIDDMVTQGGNVLVGATATVEQRVNTETKELEPKTECPAVVNGTTISNLPIPSRVMIGFNHFEVDDGILELDLVQPGVYTVVVRSLTHLEGKYEVVSEG